MLSLIFRSRILLLLDEITWLAAHTMVVFEVSKSIVLNKLFRDRYLSLSLR